MQFQGTSLVASLAALLCGFTASGIATDLEAAGQRWWSYVEHLASDPMEGRLTGSEGYQRAAGYVTEQFKASGVEAKGVKGYLQPVRFDVQRIQAAQSSLSTEPKRP